MKQFIFSKHKNFFVIFILIIIVVVGIFYLMRFKNESNIQPYDLEHQDDVPIFVASSSLVSPISPLSPPESFGPTPTPFKLDELQPIIDQGIHQLENGEHQAALETFNEILALDANNYVAYNARGSVYTALGDYQKALNDYSKAIELEPFFPSPYYNRGRIYSLFKKYDEALIDLQKSIELARGEFGYRANGNIGLIYHKQGEYDKALEAFDSAITYDDSKADTFYLRGETYTALENYEAAISDYQAAIARFANYDLAYQSLGYAYYKTGQFEQALEALNQALEISPNSPTTHFYLALIYVAKNDFEEAQAETSQAMNSTDTLSEEEQKSLFTRVLADLETFVQENPEKAKEVDSIINLIPES